MRIKGPNHQGLTGLQRWLFRTMKLDPVAINLSAVRRKFRLNQDALKIRGGLKLIGLKNNGATSGGIFANFNNGGIKARHENGSAQ